MPLTYIVHGLHVMIGTAFLAVGLWRVLAYHLTNNHHLGLEAEYFTDILSDVVLLFLFVFLYSWGYWSSVFLQLTCYANCTSFFMNYMW